MEGVAITFSQLEVLKMEFHTHMSDGKLQDSSIVHSHMDKLICFLKEKNIINDKKVLLYCHTDGCR